MAALSDAAEDVRWNAAIALGRRGDPAAAPVLLQMLDRAGPRQDRGCHARAGRGRALSAIPAAAAQRDPALRAALEALRDKDPSLKVREAAHEALAAAQ